MASTDKLIDDTLIAAHVARMRESASLSEEVAELEHVVCTAIAPFNAPEAPEVEALHVSLIEALERTGDDLAATLLEATALLARGRSAQAARAAAARLADAGHPGRLPDGFAALAVADAERVDLEAGEIFLLRLRREGSKGTQAAFLVVDHADTRGALVAGALAGPATDDPGLDGLLPPADPHAPPLPREPIAADPLAAEIRAAAARSAEIGLEVDHELGLALPLLARALTGATDGLPALTVLPPTGMLDVDPEDRAAFDGVAEQLLGDFEAWLGADASDRVLAAADELLEFGFTQRDGRLGEWTSEELERFLLDHVPRSAMLLPADADRLPGDVAGFLRFLQAEDLHDGEPVLELERTLLRLDGPYREAVRDPARFGPSKAIVMQMRSEGVELTDQAALEEWMADFNARPYAERDRVFGSAVRPPARPAGAARDRSKRKAAKQARRRNRR